MSSCSTWTIILCVPLVELSFQCFMFIVLPSLSTVKSPLCSAAFTLVVSFSKNSPPLIVAVNAGSTVFEPALETATVGAVI